MLAWCDMQALYHNICGNKVIILWASLNLGTIGIIIAENENKIEAVNPQIGGRQVKICFTVLPSGRLVSEKAGFYPSSSYFLHRKAFFVHNTSQKDTVAKLSGSRIL